MQTQIDLPFGDGVYTFRLALPQINELQRKTGSGIGALFARVLRGRYADRLSGVEFGQPMEAEFSAADVLEPIRLGLIGGNHGIVDGEHVQVDPTTATALMEAYTYPTRPLTEAWALAASILMACVEGYEEPDQKKSAGEMPEPPTTAMEADGSTTPAPSPISPPPDAV